MKSVFEFEKSANTLFFLSFFSGVFAVFSLKCGTSFILTWSLVSPISSMLEFSLLFDSLSLLFATVVFYISANVFVFSKTYMGEEENKVRFNQLVCLFVLSMCFMIFVPNLVAVLLGWDGLGLVSFVLVCYYQSFKSVSASMLTALTNRLGDVFILLSIIWVYGSGHWGFCFLSLSHSDSVILWCILLAAMTKSAQIPFCSWLPAAMAAPTPVSALVHSSTLVTAGVFLLLRFSYLMVGYSYLLNSLFFIGALTMMMAGWGAFFECDLKKVIAMSTLSQLGVMVLSLSLAVKEVTAFHLLTHALFKALFFICAGGLIHCFVSGQDMRLLSSPSMFTPVSVVCLSFSSLALCGAPFMAGFYSKDMIIELLLASNFSLVSALFLGLGAILTVLYTMKFLYYIFWRSGPQISFSSISDGGKWVVGPMVALAMGSLLGGNLLSWAHFNFFDVGLMPLSLKSSAVCCVVGAFLCGIFLPVLNWECTNKSVLGFVSSLWFLSPLTAQGMAGQSLSGVYFVLKNLDMSWVEVMGPQGFAKMDWGLSRISQRLQFNEMSSFLFLFFFFTFLFLGGFFWFS
uniref:NADH-ubiquinone oxidoreductase chain 5 n=1 Tax=Scutopus robustus TaxID=2109553 RepID=A0A343YNC2_9MOLL|nr:NADH dehydrogenase subunit 5 [Scutopus robustus]AWL21429.1 NADH dehydrogenase subunit 5 [Scutopus robustus]